MVYKHSLLAVGAVIGIVLTVALTMAFNSGVTGNVPFEKSINDDVSNCPGLRVQCKQCLYQPYNYKGRQMCASLCERYFDKCYEKIFPVTPFVRG